MTEPSAITAGNTNDAGSNANCRGSLYINGEHVVYLRALGSYEFSPIFVQKGDKVKLIQEYCPSNSSYYGPDLHKYKLK